MKNKKEISFLVAAVLLLSAAFLIKSGATGMSVYDVAETSSGNAIISGIFLFSFVAGILLLTSRRGSDVQKPSDDEIINILQEISRDVAEERKSRSK
jgi:cytochrome c biogenesis factor